MGKKNKIVCWIVSIIDSLSGVVVECLPLVLKVSNSIPSPGHTKDFKNGSNGCLPWLSWLQG